MKNNIKHHNNRTLITYESNKGESENDKKTNKKHEKYF